MQPPPRPSYAAPIAVLAILASVFYILPALFLHVPPPQDIQIAPSLSSLPPTSRPRIIYPHTLYPNGKLARLPYGNVQYWILGKPSDKKVVLIHGFSIPSIIWQDVAPHLASQGFQVLLYDLYGRGYSDAPHVTYDAKLYTTQLALLMQHVGWDKAHVVGLSMGGGIAAAFADAFPNLIAGRVALLAAAGLMEAKDYSRTSRFMSSPIIQAVTSTSVMKFFLSQVPLKSNTTAEQLQELVQHQAHFLPGYGHALSSSLRGGPIRGLSSSFEALAFNDFHVLLIWGTEDKTVPYKYARQIQDLVPTAELLTIPGAGHELTVYNAEIVRDRLTAFLRS